MGFTAHRASQITIILLISVVVTQLVYFGLSSVGADINRSIIWTLEAVAFLGIAVFALLPLAYRARFGGAWAAIAVSGILNLVQVGMGLAMFGPVKDAGAAMAPAFEAILAGAFFLYFAAKVLLGGAAIAVGAGLMIDGKPGAKIIGILAMLLGLAAMLTNIYALGAGMGIMVIAGGAGTAATFVLAIALIVADRHGRRVVV